MFTSIGYHTFVISKNLTREEAGRLLKDFKRYRDNTKEICIIGPKTYHTDPFGKHCEIKYVGQYKGIWWKIRFSRRGFCEDDEFKPCSIKAVINPKTLIGEKSYIVAADAGMLEDVRRNFEQGAEKISPILKGFDDYSLNRIDYCINFDVSELELGCPAELTKKLPEWIMELIKCADIPKHFSEEYDKKHQFYLKSNSVVVNCYWKHTELKENFPNCKDMEKSYYIIRFEIQFRYPKVQESIRKLKPKMEQRSYNSAKSIGNRDLSENGDNADELKLNQLCDAYREKCPGILEKMLSDEKCTLVIDDYFTKIIKNGDYYTFDAAKSIIRDKVPKWEKEVRLTGTLEMIRNYGGISKVKDALRGKELEDFRRSLRELEKLQINPVTIPEDWGIEHIPNLLTNHYHMRAEEQKREKEEKEKEEMLREYIEDCRKKGKSL